VENAFQEAKPSHLGHGCIDLGTAHASKFGRESQEAVDGHVRIAGSAFGQVADQFLGRDGFFGNVMVTDAYPTRGGREKPGDHAHGRRFAGAIGPEETEDLATADREGNSVHCPLGPELLDQIFYVNHCQSRGVKTSVALESEVKAAFNAAKTAERQQ